MLNQTTSSSTLSKAAKCIFALSSIGCLNSSTLSAMESPLRQDNDCQRSGNVSQSMDYETESVKFICSRSSTLHKDEQAWKVPVLKSICNFSELESGWDSYGAESISSESIKISYGLAEYFYSQKLIKPYVFPTPDGGVQFEWHLTNVDVEIEISPNASVEVLCTSKSDDYERKYDGVDSLLMDDIAKYWLSMLTDAGR